MTHFRAAATLWLVLGIAGAGTLGFAPVASGAALTAAAAVNLALQNNPDLLAARQQLTIAEGRLVKARYWNPFNPFVGGGAAQRRFGLGGTAAEPAASVSVEIEIGGQKGKRIKEAEGNLRRVRAEVHDAERRITAQVETAFFRVLYFRQRLDLFRRLEAQNRRLRDASRARFLAGETAKLEANLAALRYVQSRRDLLSANRDFRNQSRALERLLGLQPTATIQVAGRMTIRDEKLDPLTLTRVALNARPDLRARRFEIGRVRSTISLTRRLIVPNLVVSANFAQEANQGAGPDNIFGGLAGISIPLFDRKQGELTSLGGELRRARYQRTSTVLRIRTEVRDAIQSYEAAREAARVFQSDALKRTDESFRFIEIAYRRGKIDLLQFVVLQNDLIRSSLSYLDSLWDYAQARVNLERALGVSLDKLVTP